MSEFKKPTFDVECIKAKVTGISTIEENMQQAKEYAIQLRDYYTKLVFEDSDIDIAKEEKANVNKVKKKIDDVRKEITKEFNKPLETFVNTAKETVAILDDAYTCINSQVNTFEDLKRNKIEQELRDLYVEYIKSSNLEEFNIPFEDCCPKVNISGSMKSKKDSVIEFVENRAKDIELIRTEEYSTEILNEYLKNGYDYTNAKLVVLNRKLELEKIEQVKQTLERQHQEEEIVIEKVDEVIAPIEITEVADTERKFSQVSFTLLDVTETQVKELKEFLKERNIRYE
jgi:hypothetical protein